MDLLTSEVKIGEIKVSVGDVVQLNEQARDEFQYKFLLVTEVKDWGIIGFVDTFAGRAYYRAPTGHFERIGKAPFVSL